MSILGSAVLLAILRTVVPERGLSDTGPQALLNGLFALGLLAIVLSIALAVGGALLGWLQLSPLTRLEAICLAVALGVGVLSYQLLALGLLGALAPLPIAIVLAVDAFAFRRKLTSHLTGMNLAWTDLRKRWQSLDPSHRLMIVFAIFMGILTLLRALTPPWSYDALMYHLEAPRAFLESGRIFPSRQQLWLNMPLSIEMLFTIGMAFGSDTFAKLINLSLAVLLVGSTYVFARRFVGDPIALVSVAILLGMPVIPYWASIANVDFGWATFQLLGFYAIFSWWRWGGRPWLLAAGVLLGLALGSKYAAIVGFASVIALVLWIGRKSKFHSVSLDVATFLIPGLIVASPWYLKNLLWLGDPTFPILSSMAGTADRSMSLLVAYWKSYGPAHTFVDWLSIPVRLYTQPAVFDETAPFLSGPSALFPLLLAYPLIAKHRVVTISLALALGQLVALASVALVMRHLLPLYPLLCIAAAYVIRTIGSSARTPKLLGGSMRWIVLLTLSASLLIQVGLFLRLSPLGVIVGVESSDQFLRRSVSTYSAMSHAIEKLPSGNRLLTTGDGRLYYCRERCVRTDNQFLWLAMVIESRTASEFGGHMRSLGAGYLLVSWRDIDLFHLHNPDGVVQGAVDKLFGFIRTCGRRIYADREAEIYEMSCT